MPATPCEECLTKDGVMVVAFGDDRCRRCGHQPTPGALTPKEIRACLAASATERQGESG